MPAGENSPQGTDSPYAAARLGVTLLLMMLGASGMYVVPVVLPAVQAEFGIARADASMPYSLLMLGFGVGGLVMGRLADRFGVMVPLLIGAVCLGAGFVMAGNAPGIGTFNIAHGLLMGLCGSAATFSPLIADTSLWWIRRRGIAVAVCASGNYLGGAVWPPIVQHFVESYGWRQTYVGIGITVGIAMALLALAMRRRPPIAVHGTSGAPSIGTHGRPFGLQTPAALGLLMVAGLACCVAMSMPQVHIVAYCARPRIWTRAWRRDALAHAGLRHREPPGLRRDLRPHRGPAHAAAGLGAAGRGAAALPAVPRASCRST